MFKLRYLNPLYLVKGTIKKIEHFINIFLFSVQRKLRLIKCAKIVKPQLHGNIVHIFKEPSIEIVEMNEVYQFIKTGSFEVIYPEIDLWKFNGATITEGADYILFDNNEVVWQKYFAYNYSKNFPLDKFYLKEENGFLYYRTPKRELHVDVAFSLLGVHDQIWSHSLSEYFPKIFELQHAIKDASTRVKVLVPVYTDKQLKEIIYSELSKYKGIDILPIESDVVVKVDTLYYMERPTTFTDHELSVAIGDDVQPRIIAEILKDKLVAPRVEAIDCNEPIKLFLPRRGFGRNLINYREVEAYFKQQGYIFMDYPHKISLEEKIKMFRSADVVVGPFGSAFSNILFCRPKTKVLIFSNYSRIYEAWLCMHKKYFDLKMLWVTGYDNKGAENKSHCSYYIPLTKILSAAQSLGI